MRLIVLVSYFVATSFGVPVPPDSSHLLRGDIAVQSELLKLPTKPESQVTQLLQPAPQLPYAETISFPASTQAHPSAHTHFWQPPVYYNPNANAGYSLSPPQNQYAPVPPLSQFVYFPMFGAPPSPMGQQFIYAVKQPIVNPFGGISSEEIQLPVQMFLPQLGTGIPPHSAGPVVPFGQPLNPGFPAFPLGLYPNVPALPTSGLMPNFQLSNPTLINVGQPAEDIVPPFRSFPAVDEIPVMADSVIPPPSQSSPSSADFNQVFPTILIITPSAANAEIPPQPSNAYVY